MEDAAYQLYQTRMKAIYDSWENTPELWKEAEALIFMNGQVDEELIYKRTIALFIWLFSKELNNVILMLTKEKIILAASSKYDELRRLSEYPIEGHNIEFQFIEVDTSGTTEELNISFNQLTSVVEGVERIGRLVRDKHVGEFVSAWNEHLIGSFSDYVLNNNISAAVSSMYAVKSLPEQKCCQTAAAISAVVLKKHLLPEIETIIDEEKKITHATLAERGEDLFATPKKISPKLDTSVVESCYTPIIQSGDMYDLQPSAVSNDEPLHFGTIIVALGARFKYYCSNVARTYFINPKEDQEENYNFLLRVYNKVIEELRPGKKLSSVLKNTKSFVKKMRPDLVDKLVPSLGFGMGIEFREAAYSLNKTCSRTAESGMVFNVCVGFKDIELKNPSNDDPKRNTYSMLVADTVLLTSTDPQILTKSCPKSYDEVSYEIGDSEEGSEEEGISNGGREGAGMGGERAGSSAGRTRSSRSRDNQDVAKAKEMEKKRKSHQLELARKKREEAQRRLAKGDAMGGDGTVPIAYKNPQQFPAEVTSNVDKIYVDLEKQAVLLPIAGRLVPFHMKCIKSVSKQDEYLRINFETDSPFAGEDSLYIKEVTFRCSNVRDLNNSFRMIKELRKTMVAKQRDALNPIFKQEDLILSKSKVPRLTDLMIRPQLGGRRTTGTLEAHKNGFRFRSNKGPTLPIIYKNIKHAFFQPAENELIVIIHFHLHQNIMIGKKKSNNVQVYAEVMEVTHNLDRRRGGMFDRDERDDERREAQLRLRLNAEFQSFVKKVEGLVPGLEFDIPYRELGFTGVPHRTSVLLQPTVNCLVSLVEQPFFVLTLAEIELAHFERVQFNLRNFDLVFVYKDLNKSPAVINAIPSSHLETIKEWLDQYNIQFYAGPTNLNWNRILSAIREDPKAFWDDGGWAFLDMEASSDNDEDSEEEVDVYVPSDEGDDEVSFSAGSESEDDSEYDEDSEDDGEDWDDLEKKAIKADRQKKYDTHIPTKRRRRNDQYSDNSSDNDESHTSRRQDKSKRRRRGR